VLAFLADENFNRRIVHGLRRRRPDLDIVRVQDVGLSGANDPTMAGHCTHFAPAVLFTMVPGWRKIGVEAPNMSVTATRPGRLPAPPDRGIGPRRWTREEYHRAADAGLFRPEERLELLDGEIIARMTQNEPHASVAARAARLLAAVFGPDHHTRTHSPIILNGRSEPEPDVIVVPGTEFDYLSHHPGPADIRLLVEVSDTTLRYDRGRKRIAYARAGILEYWIVNLPERQLEVYRDPSSSRFRSGVVYREEDAVAPLAAPSRGGAGALAVRVADLLPPIS
jgi:Uma2 family endonuclease